MRRALPVSYFNTNWKLFDKLFTTLTDTEYNRRETGQKDNSKQLSKMQHINILYVRDKIIKSYDNI